MFRKENTFDVGNMHIRLHLPGEPLGQCLIPVLSHGDRIVVIETGAEDLKDCDALITENHSFSLGIKTADCAAICFSDGKRIGIAHVGWRGLCKGLIEKMLPYFEKDSLSIYVAPFLNTFEIQKDFCYDEISKKFGTQFFKGEGPTLFDFKGAIMSILPARAVFDSRSTATDTSFPSNRRDKTVERFVTAVRFHD